MIVKKKVRFIKKTLKKHFSTFRVAQEWRFFSPFDLLFDGENIRHFLMKKKKKNT